MFRRTLCTARLLRPASAPYCTAAGVTDAVDCVVVGAGVIGLACARAAAQSGLEVVLLEAESTFGSITSSRHSEVIHAGIYYPAGSLKARFCVEGKHMLYQYCRERGINHNNIGKLIVAASKQQIPKLQQLKQFAAANGVPDLHVLSGAEAVALEPALSAAAALLSPSTGIIDSHGYMEALLQDAEAAGAVFATHSKFVGARQVPGTFAGAAARQSSSSVSHSPGGNSTNSSDDGSTPATSTRTTKQSSSSNSSRGLSHRAARPLLQVDVQDTGGGEVSQLHTRWLINAAGLSAQAVASNISPTPAAIPKQYLAKGNYFSLSCKAPFTRLIYPLPEDGGLGVHLTLDLAGQARFGPDVQWVESKEDYFVDPGRAVCFYPAIRKYYPALPDGALQPGYAGIRPKLTGPGQPAADFVLQSSRDHGVAGLVNLYGIESPGLTSSLAIAKAVLGMIL